MATVSKPLKKVAFHTDWLDVPVMLDVAGVAIVLGHNPQVVRTALREGRLPGVKTLKEWRVRKDELMAFLGYKPWEIERYGFGMSVPAQGRGYNPIIQDDFSTVLDQKGAAG